MKPSKQESVSRQSSILKAPKQRQPLQCVATNPSSSENSPTVKIKRRVSFAKNRRIRQFCNEAEQETVWDNTYEEHDSSHTKSSSSGSPDKPIIISVPSDDKENFPVQLFLKDNELDCKEVATNVLEGDDLSECDMEMDNSLINPEKALPENNENEFPNATIYCDDGMDMTSFEPTNIIPCSTGSTFLEDTAAISRTCIQDTSMELTENIPYIISKNLNEQQKNVSSTDLTQALSKLLGTGRLNKHTDTVLSKEGSEITDTLPVGFTSILPSSTWIKPNTPCVNNENTDNFNNKTMEFTTAAVPYADIQANTNNQKLHNKIRLSEKTEIFSNKSMDVTEAVCMHNKDLLNNYNLKPDSQNFIQEKTEIFGNKSMEITEAISNYNKKLHSDEQTRILNTSMEMTEIPVCNKIHQINANSHDSAHEKTRIFLDKSMEITEAVSINKINSNTQSLNSHAFAEKEDKTEIFYDKSMEMTEGIPIFNKNVQCGDTKEKTRVFLDESVEITKNIAVHKIDQPGANKIGNNNVIFEEKTAIFPNASMEMTEAVHSNKFNKTNEHKNLQDKTNIFVNKSMEMTDVISGSRNVNHVNELSQEKTKIFSNKSMEITEPVYLHKAIDEGLQEKTEIFANKSMEITAAIHGHSRLTQFNTSMELTEAALKNIQQFKDSSLLHEDIENRTKMFANKSMDVTETVPMNPIISNMHKIQHNNAIEKNTIFNKSMDLTEGISINPKLFELQKLYMNKEKTEHFNKSMDITEAVPMNHRHFEYKQLCKQNLNEEKTECFINKSMEITEAIPNNCESFKSKILPEHYLNEERTEHFINKSMDITEAIPMQHSIFTSKKLPVQDLNGEEKTECFINKSMEITEAISNNYKCFEPKRLPEHYLNEERTEHFINKSMDITEAIPAQKSVFTSKELSKQDFNGEKTEYFINKSMDITAAIPVKHNAFIPKELPKRDLNEEKTENFTNTLMDMTASVPMSLNNIHNLQKPRIISNELVTDKINYFSNKPADITKATTEQITQDKTKYFLDNSMNITESIPINQEGLKTRYNSQNNLKNYEKTKVFIDKSMDLTEAVIADIDNFMTKENVSEIPLDRSKNSKSNTSCITDINCRQSNAERIDEDIFVEMTSRLPKNNSDKYHQSGLVESNKQYQDISLDYTEPDILSFSRTNSKPLQSSNIQRNLSSMANKEETKFQRLTTDELQILCASLNLPTQKVEKEQSAISQNTPNFITDCNDVNVLLDSLKNKSNFQKSNIIPEEDKSFTISSAINKDFKMNYDFDIGKKNIDRPQLDTGRTVPSIMDVSTFGKSVMNKSDVLQNDFDSSKTSLCKTMTIPALMEIDTTAEINLKPPELFEISCSVSKLVPESHSTNANNGFAKAPLIFNHEDPKTSEIIMADPVTSTAHLAGAEDNRSFRVHNEPIASSVKRKSSEKNQSPVSKKNYISPTNKSVHSQESVNNGKENCDVGSKDNSLSRMPSDSTDVLVATMGFKTNLPHPLIINDKTTITVSTKSFSNKTYSIGVCSNIQGEIQADKTYVVNKVENQIELRNENIDKKELENENLKNVSEIVVENHVEENEEQECHSDKESTGSRIKENLFPESYSEELEEIQPPSFLDFDSLQDESLNKKEIQNDDLSNPVLSSSNKQLSNSVLCKEKNNVIVDTNVKENPSSDVIRRLSNVDLNPPEKIMSKQKKHSKKNKIKKIENFEKIPSQEVNQEIVTPLTPFELLTENIKAHEKRDDCIWSLRSLSSNMIAADFISKSLVFVIRLHPFDEEHNKDIENIQIISRLRSDSKNVLIKIVHNLLLAKLKPVELLEKCKIYEDVLPMLDYVSSEVVFAMNFMFDIERLKATNVFDVDEERIIFMVASKKTNIILKVSLLLKVFNEIKADDVHVTCILGDIRKNDIKQMIVNIKKDSKFLSRYINDVRDYITLMEESTYLNKH